MKTSISEQIYNPEPNLLAEIEADQAKRKAAKATVHSFEAAGLGQAPFKVVGFESTADRIGEMTQRAAKGLMYTTNPCGGTCAYCGQAIFNVFVIQAADGKKFKVGSDCVKKAGDAGIKLVASSVINAVARDKRQATDDAKIAAGKELLPSVRAKLAGKPHPTNPREDRSLLTYVEFLFANAGREGQVKAAFIVTREAALGDQ